MSLAVVQETLQSVGLGQYFDVTPKGLIVKGSPSFEACEALWETFLTVHQTIQMAMGDAAKFFTDRFGERASQILSARSGWSLETQRNYLWVAESVPAEVRRLDVLSFSHHQAVARLTPKEQKKWLTEAANEGGEKPWPVQRLKAAIKNGADSAVSSWFVLARAKDEESRDTLMRELEVRGYVCKATEKRGVNR